MIDKVLMLDKVFIQIIVASLTLLSIIYLIEFVADIIKDRIKNK